MHRVRLSTAGDTIGKYSSCIMQILKNVDYQKLRLHVIHQLWLKLNRDAEEKNIYKIIGCTKIDQFC